MRHIAVIDIGKTNAKVLVADLATGAETTIARCRNRVIETGPYPHFDIAALDGFLREGLRALGRSQAVDAVSITTHGAAAALVEASGALALPVLDYEHRGPEALAAGYAALRPDFAETGSPRLPMGLNLGAQIYWQAQRFPEAFARVRHILTLPQYWSFRLTGVGASEVTSLGCHTDLWNPFAGGFSTLVDSMGWRALFPPLRGAGEVLGPLRPDIAAETGLAPDTPVLTGIHDSNASLVPWLGGNGPRAVVSTGTWMIAMALGGAPGPLDPARDVLVNVNARGAPVPTARFMAGREFEEITGGAQVSPSAAEEAAVLSQRRIALPSLHPGTGPFPDLRFAWSPAAPDGAGQTAAAAAFYAALMGAECLRLIGAAGEVIVEGPFGANTGFLRMLATATGRPVVAAGAGAGTSLGAAMLAAPAQAARAMPPAIRPETDPLWTGYAAAWRDLVARRAGGQAM